MLLVKKAKYWRIGSSNLEGLLTNEWYYCTLSFDNLEQSFGVPGHRYDGCILDGPRPRSL